MCWIGSHPALPLPILHFFSQISLSILFLSSSLSSLRISLPSSPLFLSHPSFLLFLIYQLLYKCSGEQLWRGPGSVRCVLFKVSRVEQSCEHTQPHLTLRLNGSYCVNFISSCSCFCSCYCVFFINLSLPCLYPTYLPPSTFCLTISLTLFTTVSLPLCCFCLDFACLKRPPTTLPFSSFLAYPPI